MLVTVITMSDDENLKEKADDESLCDFEMMYNGQGSHSPELSESTLVRLLCVSLALMWL